MNDYTGVLGGFDFGEFRPMLFSNDKPDFENIHYSDKCALLKYDGLRLEITNKGVYSRKLELINNINVQKKFKKVVKYLPDGVILEAELWSPDLPLRTISGLANSDKKSLPENLNAYVFDIYVYEQDYTYEQRLKVMKTYTDKFPTLLKEIQVIPLANYDHLQQLFKLFVTEGGNEGLIIRNYDSHYKCGRLSNKMDNTYKYKPHKELDCEIVGVNERMKNLNDSEIDALGHKYKRNTVADKEPTGIAATLTVKLPNGELSKPTLKGTEAERREIWENREEYIGRIAVIEAMDHGELKKLRHGKILRIK